MRIQQLRFYLNHMSIKLSCIYSMLFISCSILAQQNTAENLTDVTVAERDKKPIQQQTSEADWWYDFHQTISNSVFDTAHWFDSFFAQNDNSDLTPQTSARIRLGWEPRSRDFDKFDAKFRLKVKLPHLANRVDLIFTDDSQDDFSTLPLESVSQTNNDDSISAAVRVVHKIDSKRFFDTRVGASGGDIFVKSRYKRQFKFSTLSNFTIEPSLYYFAKEGLAERLLLQYDYQATQTAQYRLSYSIRGSEAFSGIRWKHAAYRFKQLDNNAASMMGIIVNGERNGAEGFFIENYSVNYRYRFNAYKKWLFFEIEPFIEWPRDNDYSATPGIALRVEGFFNRE